MWTCELRQTHQLSTGYLRPLTPWKQGPQQRLSLFIRRCAHTQTNIHSVTRCKCHSGLRWLLCWLCTLGGCSRKGFQREGGDKRKEGGCGRAGMNCAAQQEASQKFAKCNKPFLCFAAVMIWIWVRRKRSNQKTVNHFWGGWGHSSEMFTSPSQVSRL